jgi:hypothetical protein
MKFRNFLGLVGAATISLWLSLGLATSASAEDKVVGIGVGAGFEVFYGAALSSLSTHASRSSAPGPGRER